MFFNGRIIGVSHVAFGATRVMATSAYVGQAVAASICKQYGITPAAVYREGYIDRLQRGLIKTSQYIPGAAFRDDSDLVQQASITGSGELAFSGFGGAKMVWRPLDISAVQLIPPPAGKVPTFAFNIRTEQETVDEDDKKRDPLPCEVTGPPQWG